MRLIITGFAAVGLLSLPTLAESTKNTPVTSSQVEAELLPDSLLQISETEAFSRFVFLVDKAQRKLIVYERNGEQIRKVQEVPTDIGKMGGNKTKRDDHKTPEGIYFLEEKLSQPEIPFSLYGNLAFTTNYPNIFDRREKKTGSGIWLHAVPDSVPLTRGSRGCVVVRNDMIKKLSDFVKLRETPILIFDQVNYISKTKHEKRRLELTNFVESWRQAWETQDIERYMTYYAEDFKAPGFNLGSWKKHKENMKKKYDYIKVHLSQPYIVQHNDQLVVKTLQRYESDKYVDYGVKTIYALKDGETFKIIREEWLPFNQQKVVEAISKEGFTATQALQQSSQPN